MVIWGETKRGWEKLNTGMRTNKGGGKSWVNPGFSLGPGTATWAFPVISFQRRDYSTVNRFFPLPSIFFNSLSCLLKGVGDGFLILATREFPTYTLKCITFKVSIMCVLEMPWLPHENSLCTLELKESLFNSDCLAGANAQGRADLE